MTTYTCPAILEILQRRAERKQEEDRYAALTEAQKGCVYGCKEFYKALDGSFELSSRIVAILALRQRLRLRNSVLSKDDDFRTASSGEFESHLNDWIRTQSHPEELAVFFASQEGQ